ncbi:hypothetical protein WR25_25214 [Diploscapter pachys]|uniref:RNA-directed DNA polymerase n=1 Tax=Diploscapter pachys TaxID=2018661 RepID=A0A2A2LFB6_9BILA|nr:hypothetical protein WR25_25214 [Diploscapter pachys]
MQKKLEFLGHILTSEGIQTSPKKLEAIVNMPEQKNLKEVVSFLSMAQYYGKFIPQLATIAAPLNHLRKQGVPFEMTPERQKAVQEIKKRLTQTDILTHFNPDIPVILATDASDYGIGAVIYHKLSDGTEKVIAYASRTLTQTERNYAQIEKEALGIVYGVEKFNQFLYGRKFTLLTDHQPLTKIFGPKTELPIIAARRLHRWALRLMAYSFNIEYRNTHEFGNADGLSRLPNPNELPSSLGLNEEDVRLATAKDEKLSKIIHFIQTKWPKKNNDPNLKLYFIKASELSVHKGIILWNHRVVIPPTLQMKALQILHRNHYGRNRMIALARSKIWFPGIDRMITQIAEDAKSKWSKVIYMRNMTTTSKTIQKLNELFATHGIPEQFQGQKEKTFFEQREKTSFEVQIAGEKKEVQI